MIRYVESLVLGITPKDIIMGKREECSYHETAGEAVGSGLQETMLE